MRGIFGTSVLRLDTRQCGEPILMDQTSQAFGIFFCTLVRYHDGPCKDDKGRWFKPAERVEPKARKKRAVKKK